MSNKRYDDLIRALVPKQPGPQHGHQPAGHQPMTAYPVYPPAGPYYQGQAPIIYQQAPPAPPAPYQRADYPPVDHWPTMPGPEPLRQPQQPRKQGPSAIDTAAVIFVVACVLIFLAAMLPQ
jgi:hypothetical protein